MELRLESRIPDAKGATALDIAIAKDRIFVAQLLKTHHARMAGTPPAELPVELVEAAVAGDTLSVETWIECGGPVDCRRGGEGGSTLLMLASEHGHEPLAEVLLGCGANTELASKEGSTALMIAAQRGHRMIVRRLMQWRLKQQGTLAARGKFDVPEIYMEFRNRQSRTTISPLSI